MEGEGTRSLVFAAVKCGLRAAASVIESNAPDSRLRRPFAHKPSGTIMSKATLLRIAEVAAQEARRAHTHLKKGRQPRAFFVSHLIRDEEVWRVDARFGTLFGSRHGRGRTCLTDVRVGSYRRDQIQEGGLNDNSQDDESYGYVDFPIGGEIDGIRHALWKLTDARYREAVECYLRKRADELTYRDQFAHLPSFEKRPPVRDIHWGRLPPVDAPHWERFTKRCSGILKGHSRIKMSSVVVEVVNQTRIFVSSEGVLRIQRSPSWVLEAYLWMLSDKGDGFPSTLQYYVTDPDELPTEKRFKAEILARIEMLEALAKAPVMRSFSGPALLEPRPAGLLIHEALGHRLEGNRLLSHGEGQTFRDSLGTLILPPFLSIHDDPSMTRFEGKSLVGHYRFDDEGVDGQRANIVERGRLNSFLTSRAGIRKRHRSNGHARSARHQRAISRMAVTHVESHDGLTDSELRAAFVEEIRRQGVPYGIRILHADGGETSTEGYNFQAFLGEINLAAKVYPDGREEWIRGVNFVGTPLNATRSIIAAGRRHEVDNALCGAESGFVPVSTISPSLLISHLELQSKSDASYAPYTYPIPWES